MPPLHRDGHGISARLLRIRRARSRPPERILHASTNHNNFKGTKNLVMVKSQGLLRLPWPAQPSSNVLTKHTNPAPSQRDDKNVAHSHTNMPKTTCPRTWCMSRGLAC